jgi:thymidylate synthase
MDTFNPTARTIKADSISRGHELAIKSVLEKGYFKDTEDGKPTIESNTIMLYIENPLTKPQFSDKMKFGIGFLERYKQDLIFGTKSEFEYDYYSRLHAWGCGTDTSGKPININQIEYIINKLKTSKNSRRAIAITWNPPIDHIKIDVPCLQLIQFTNRNDNLDMKVIFRSNDILSAMGANMYALVGLQQHISEKIGINIGTYTHIALIPHIYYKRDIEDIEPFCGKGTYITPNKEICNLCKKCKR